MSKTTKSTDVATATNNTGVALTKQDVPQLIEQLQGQLNELKKGKKEVSTDVSYNGQNVKSVSTVKELLEISSSVHARGAAYEAEVARYALDGKVQEFTTSDKTVKQWEDIIEMAIFELINKNKIAQLESAIKKLSNHLDEDTKLQRELESIMTTATAPLQ